MKKLYGLVLTGLLCGAMALAAGADTLEMKDGRLIEGKYRGGTQKTIRFQSKKQITVYRVKDVLALTFSSKSAAVAKPTPKAPGKADMGLPTPTAPRPTDGKTTLAPGTNISISMLNTVSINTVKKDDWFSGTLHKSLVLNNVIVAPKGAKVHGQVVIAEQTREKTTLAVELRELELNNKIIQIATKPYTIYSKAETVFGVSSLKIVTRQKTLQIPYRKVVDFELSKAISFDK